VTNKCARVCSHCRCTFSSSSFRRSRLRLFRFVKTARFHRDTLSDVTLLRRLLKVGYFPETPKSMVSQPPREARFAEASFPPSIRVLGFSTRGRSLSFPQLSSSDNNFKRGKAAGPRGVDQPKTNYGRVTCTVIYGCRLPPQLPYRSIALAPLRKCERSRASR